MSSLKKVLIGILGVAVLAAAIGLGMAPHSQALETKRVFNFNKLFKGLFPPCGPKYKNKRFVVSKDGNSVCDNKTGLWWEQSPSTALILWGPDEGVNNAIDHCANLTLSGKAWRLAGENELLTLVNFSDPNPAAALNMPEGPFQDVQSAKYWSATELAGITGEAWVVDFLFPSVALELKFDIYHAWCVSDGKKKHAH